MKKSYICLVIIVFVCFCVFAYSLEYSNKYKNSRMAEDKSIEEASTEDKTETEEYSNCPFTEEELEQTLKTVIEDDLRIKHLYFIIVLIRKSNTSISIRSLVIQMEVM